MLEIMAALVLTYATLPSDALINSYYEADMQGEIHLSITDLRLLQIADNLNNQEVSRIDDPSKKLNIHIIH